jgi:hypothetical protein
MAEGRQSAAHKSNEGGSSDSTLPRKQSSLYPYDDRPCDPRTGSPRGRSVGLPTSQKPTQRDLSGSDVASSLQYAQTSFLPAFREELSSLVFPVPIPDVRARSMSFSISSSETDETHCPLSWDSTSCDSAASSAPASPLPNLALGRRRSTQLSNIRESIHNSIQDISTSKISHRRRSIAVQLPYFKLDESFSDTNYSSINSIRESLETFPAVFPAFYDEPDRNETWLTNVSNTSVAAWGTDGGFLDAHLAPQNSSLSWNSHSPVDNTEDSLMSALDYYQRFLESNSSHSHSH